MSLTNILVAVFLAFLPISELRGSIPFLVYKGASVPFAFALSVACNALVPLVAFLFLETVHRLLYRVAWYRRLFDRFVERARGKVHKEVEKYGYLGLLVFVAIPLPVTGAWTGTLGAWVLGMERKKATVAIMGGVLVAGIVVSLVVFFGVGALSIFIKKV